MVSSVFSLFSGGFVGAWATQNKTVFFQMYIGGFGGRKTKTGLCATTKQRNMHNLPPPFAAPLSFGWLSLCLAP
jgi:hypothetical protein